MLNLKKVLTKLCGRVNYRIVSVNSESFSMEQSGTKWITVPRPSSGTVIALSGYYINGNSTATIYNARLTSSGAQFAIRNPATVAIASMYITADYLVVD